MVEQVNIRNRVARVAPVASAAAPEAVDKQGNRVEDIQADAGSSEIVPAERERFVNRSVYHRLVPAPGQHPEHF